MVVSEGIVCHEFLQFAGIVVGDFGGGGLLLFPSELVERNGIGRDVILFAVAEHSRKEPLQGTGVLPSGAVTAVKTIEVAVHLPPLHPIQEIRRVDAALSHYHRIELEGGYTFFPASSCLAGSADLSGW